MEAKIREYELQKQKFEEEREQMASKFQKSLSMLQDLKSSHQTLEHQNREKEEKIGKMREEHTSQTRELKKNLERKYQEDVQSFQSSYMQRFEMKKNNQSREGSVEKSPVKNEKSNDAAIRALEEVSSLKEEIRRLTSSL